MKKYHLLIGMLIALSIFLAACDDSSENDPDTDTNTEQTDRSGFMITSSAFEDGADIPDLYASVAISSGQNTSIPLTWINAPASTQTFALVMVDKHEIANNFIHWMVVNISHDTTSIAEGATLSEEFSASAHEMENSYGYQGYGGPQPPENTGPHEYEIILYSLDSNLILEKNAMTYNQFVKMIKDNIISQTSITGFFER